MDVFEVNKLVSHFRLKGYGHLGISLEKSVHSPLRFNDLHVSSYS